MIWRKNVGPFVLLCFIIIVTGMIGRASLVLATPDRETLIVELDKTKAYPSQDVMITISYMVTFPETEQYTFLPDPIYLVITTSGLVQDIHTTDSLLNPYIGKSIVSGMKYKAAEVPITIPDEAGDYGANEETYEIYVSSPIESNHVSLTVLAVEEKVTIGLDKVRADPREHVVVTVKYVLDASSDVVLTRPLSFLNIKLDALTDDVTPPLVFPGVVTGGEEIILATYDLQIPENAAIRSYDIKASAGPPSLESNSIGLNLGSGQDSGIIPLFTRWDVWAGITLLGGSAIGGGYAISKIVKKHQKTPSKGTKQLLVSNPIEGKGWRIVELNPDRSVKEGTVRTLSDEEVEQIRRVTRVIDGSEYDDLEWTDPKTGETITWRGPDEIPAPPPKVVPTTSAQPQKGVTPTKKKKTIIQPQVPKPKKAVKPTVTSPAVPQIPPIVSSQPPQVKAVLKPLKWEGKLQNGIDTVNKGVQSDKRIQKVLDQYKGRRIVIDVKGETTYGIAVQSDGLVMKRKVVPRESDLYIQMSDNEMTTIFQTLKKYQEYEQYKNHPQDTKKVPEEVTKSDIIGELLVLVTKKAGLSMMPGSEKQISGIGTDDFSMLKDIFIPKTGSPNAK